MKQPYSLGAFIGKYIKIFGLLGIFVGVCLFVLTLVGVEIPVVIGTTSYGGMTSSWMLLIASPIVLIVIGLIAALFAYSSKRR